MYSCEFFHHTILHTHTNIHFQYHLVSVSEVAKLHIPMPVSSGNSVSPTHTQISVWNIVYKIIITYLRTQHFWDYAQQI